jgi:hypothetical protein
MADVTESIPGWARREQVRLDELNYDVCVAASKAHSSAFGCVTNAVSTARLAARI